MTASFQANKINRLSNLGDALKQKREELGFSLTQVSRRTLIAERYLELIEQEEWQRLPGEIYIKNFLKRYATELSLNPIRVLDAYQQKNSLVYQSSIGSLQRTLPLPSSHFIILPKLIRNSLITIAIVCLIGYLAWQFNQILVPPELTIYSPVDNFITSEAQVTVSGQTEPEVEVKVNGISLAVNDGQFSETIDLQSGLNILKISARKKYGREQILYRRIMWQPD